MSQQDGLLPDDEFIKAPSDEVLSYGPRAAEAGVAVADDVSTALELGSEADRNLIAELLQASLRELTQLMPDYLILLGPRAHPKAGNKEEIRKACDAYGLCRDELWSWVQAARRNAVRAPSQVKAWATQLGRTRYCRGTVLRMLEKQYERMIEDALRYAQSEANNLKRPRRILSRFEQALRRAKADAKDIQVVLEVCEFIDLLANAAFVKVGTGVDIGVALGKIAGEASAVEAKFVKIAESALKLKVLFEENESVEDLRDRITQGAKYIEKCVGDANSSAASLAQVEYLKTQA